MNTEQGLPADVIEAIHANRKIEAIKRLREHRGIGLKEAKQAVDVYISDHKDLLPEQESTGCLRVPGMVVAVFLIAYLIYEQIK